MIWVWVLIVLLVLQTFANWRDIQFLQDEIRSMRTGLYSLEMEMSIVRNLQKHEIKQRIMTARDPKEKP